MSLKAWYPLIDGSLENKGLDTTPLTLHGTIPFTDGRVRTAPTFSANVSNYYTMPPITKVNNFSVCCWVKISADVSTSNWIVWQGVVSDNNRFGFVYLGGTNSIGFRIGSFYQNSTIEKDKWYHLCMTMNDTNTVVCYINGIAVGTGVYKGYSFTENEALYLGKNKYTSEPLNGQLQDFRYYDHCLSPKEVKEIAKGLCLHLPLKGTNARPNLFKNSATMFNSTGNINYPYSTWKRTLEFDENSPCGINGKKLKIAFKREEGETAWCTGVFYNIAATAMPTLTIGATYCETVWARCTVPNVMLMVSVVQGQSIISNSNRTLTSEWKRYYFIFSALSETYTTCFYMENVPVGVEGVFEVCCPKLELLSPTPYIPNVDDTQYSDYVLDYEPDCSGNEFDATKYGDLTTSDSNGRYNTAVAFNGTNAFLQGLAPTNSECKEFTIATWVKLSYNTLNQAIYACRTVVGQGLILFYLGATGGIRLDDGVANNIFPSSTLEPNKWYHITVTRDATERKLYINGEFISSGATTGALANMGSMYQVGESNAQTTTPIGNFLNGSLSDFRFYTSALSADDVKELYETSVSIAHNPPSLTENAYYNYVEGQKHSTFDKSKFTVVGSPTITDDGIASGFSSSNYIRTPVIDFSKPWEISSRFKVSDITSEKMLWATASGGWYDYIYIRDKVLFTFKTSDNTERGLRVGPLTADVFYYLVVGWNGTEYYIELYDDNNRLLERKSLSSSLSLNISENYLQLGYGSSGFYTLNGYIDFKPFSIKSEGKEVFSGNKTGLDVIKPDNYTVVGSPTITEDGVASGFSMSNYLKQTNLPNLSLANTWKIAGKFTQTTSLPANYARLLAYAGATNVVPSCLVQIYENKLNFAAYSTETGDTIIASSTGRYDIELNKDYWFELEFTGNKYIGRVSTDGANYITFVDFSSSTKVISRIGCTLGAGSQSAFDIGSIDLNSFKIYVDGNLVYQPCLKIPYTESKTGIKVVDSTYLDRVKDVYDQHYLERYYAVDETTQTVYEYPLFRDSMHAYEFDEGIQASITKNGIHNATTLTEATKTSMYQNNTDTVALIEN